MSGIAGPFKSSLLKDWLRWLEALAFVEALYRSRRMHALTYRRLNQGIGLFRAAAGLADLGGGARTVDRGRLSLRRRLYFGA